MIDDAQSKQMESTQVFQWVAFKAMIVRDDQLLMGKRLDADEHGLYEVPGGKIEVGELIPEAIAREVREETGLVVANPESFKMIGVSQNDKHNVVAVFVKVEAEGEINPEEEELGELRFYSKDEIKEVLANNLARKSFAPFMQQFVNGDW